MRLISRGLCAIEAAVAMGMLVALQPNTSSLIPNTLLIMSILVSSSALPSGNSPLLQTVRTPFDECALPDELLGEIFTHVAESHCIDSNLTSPASNISNANILAPSPVYDVLTISHVNKLFRRLTIHTPSLWAWLPALNDMSESMLQTLLTRSHSRILRVAYTDDKYQPIPASMWDLLIGSGNRIGYLSIKVLGSHSGWDALTFLSLPAPSLRQCSVSFEDSDVSLLYGTSISLFNGEAPKLQNLTLRNVTVRGFRFQDFPSLSTLTFTRAETRIATDFIDFGAASLRGVQQLRMLRSLVLDNCLLSSSILNSDSKIELGSLENLSISAIYKVCVGLAIRLVLPDDCTCKISFLFVEQSSLAFAGATGTAIRRFMRSGEMFTSIAIDFTEEIVHRIRLSREGRVLHFAFKFGGHMAESPTPHTLSSQCWRSISAVLIPHLQYGYHVQLALPDHRPSCLHPPSCLDSLVPGFQSVAILEVKPISAFNNSMLVYLLINQFPSLERLKISVTDYPRQEAISAIVAVLKWREILTSRALILSVSFSDDLLDSFGYAQLECVRLALSDIASAALLSTNTTVSWDREEAQYPVWGSDSD